VTRALELGDTLGPAVRRLLPACCLVLALVLPGPVAADQYSPYEQETIDAALEEMDGSIDPDPEGKAIEEIQIVTLEVIEERDPVPRLLNVFHATTRPRIIRQELLFAEGQPYSQSRADESARNLRQLRQLSLVLVVPVRGSRPDRVKVLVITKDVWSLRINTAFSIANGQLTDLVVQPSEENLLGTHTSIGFNFYLRPDTHSFGGTYIDRRVFGSRIQTAFSANAIFNRDTGDPEGSFGYFFYGQPLFASHTDWSWGVVVAWRREITRRFIGLDLKTYDAEVTPETEAIPYVYSTDRWVGANEVTRSFGRGSKVDVSTGVEADRRAYGPDRLLLAESGAAPAAVEEFIDTQMPVSDTRISPYLQLRAYSSRFVRLLNLNTLGLQEDYRLGHSLAVRVFPASQAWGSSRNLLGVFSGGSYTLHQAGALARVVVAHTAMLSEEVDRSDAAVELRLQMVTPRLGFGRVFADGVVLNRYQNYLNERSAVGGETRLRGYPPGNFRLGDDVTAATLEYRSRPVEILAQQLGAAVFYDVGDAFDRLEEMRLKHGVGFGVRMLFPQLTRFVMRADWGFPLSAGYAPFPGALLITSGQAFELPALEPPGLTAGFGQGVQ
jgi:hypothetical protein